MIEFLKLLRSDVAFLLPKDTDSELLGLVEYLKYKGIADTCVETGGDVAVSWSGKAFAPDRVLEQCRADKIATVRCDPLESLPKLKIDTIPESGLTGVIGAMLGAIVTVPAGADIEVVGPGRVRNRSDVDGGIRYTIAGENEFVVKIIAGKKVIGLVYGVPTIVSMLG